MQKKKYAASLYSEVTKDEIFKDILNLDFPKACQAINIPSNVIKKMRTSLQTFYTFNTFFY